MEPLITATQDDGIIEGDGQRGVITSIIDATPTPDLKPGGANSQQLKQSVAAATGEDSSQRLSQPTGYVLQYLSANDRFATWWWT